MRMAFKRDNVGNGNTVICLSIYHKRGVILCESKADEEAK